MSNPTAVFVRGDLARWHDIDVFDYDTGKPVADIERCNICVEVGMESKIELTFLDGSKLKVPLLTAPTSIPDGAMLLAVKVLRTTDETHRIQVEAFTKKLVPIPEVTMVIERHCPNDLTRSPDLEMTYAKVGEALYTRQTRWLHTSLFDTYQWLSEPGSYPAKNPTNKLCSECKGTGLWVSPISNKQSPCSKGCRIP